MVTPPSRRYPLRPQPSTGRPSSLTQHSAWQARPSSWSRSSLGLQFIEPFDKDTGWNVHVNPPSGNTDFVFKKDCTTFDIGFDDKSALSGHFKVDCGSRLKADVTFTKCRE